jgi:hypothetical protein
MTYYEKEEIRNEISLLKALMEIKVEKEVSRQQRLKSVENFKKRVREKIKRYNNREDNIHYNEDGESCWWKEYFNEPFTEEEKREFIEDSWQHINLPWSPTGQWFTSHIAVCNVETSFGAKAVVYHFMGLDV